MARTRVRSPSLVHSLPDPILSDIFILACWDPTSSDLAFSRRSGPRAVTSVCRRWRGVALSASRLWDFIETSPGATCVATYLARSKDQPIDVSLKVYHWEYRSPQRRDFWEGLSEISRRKQWHRVRNINIKVVHNFDYQYLKSLESVPKVVKILNDAIDSNLLGICQTITVQLTEEAVPEFYDTGRGNLLLHLPCSQGLRLISLEGIELSFSALTRPKSFSQLRDLAFTSINLRIPDLLLPLLKLTPNLIELNINSCCLCSELEDASVLYPDYSVKLPKLKALCMQGIDEVELSLSQMFRALDMPNLRSLEFHSALDYEFSDHAINWEAICHCGAIETIVLQNVPPAGMENLLEHIEKLDGLREFTMFMDNAHPPVVFAEQFVQKLSETSCCSNLESLSILFPVDPKLIADLGVARGSLRVFVEQDMEGSDDQSFDEESDEEFNDEESSEYEFDEQVHDG